MNRRDFIKKIGLVGLGVIVAPFAVARIMAESPSVTMEQLRDRIYDGIFSDIDYGNLQFPLSAFSISQRSEGKNLILTEALQKRMDDDYTWFKQANTIPHE